MSVCGGSSWNSTVRKRRGAFGEGGPVVVEGALPQPVLPDPLEVDVGDRALRACRKPLRLGQHDAELVDHGLPVPGQVGRRLALAGGRVDVAAQPAGAGLGAQLVPLRRLADGDRAAGQVGDHGRPGQHRLAARRDRHPRVLTDLDVQLQPRHIGSREDQVGAERHVPTGQPDRPAVLVCAGSEVTLLVVLPVVREVGLRRHAQHLPAVHDDGAVVEPVAVLQRGTDDDDRKQVDARADHVHQGLIHRVEQWLLQQQVVDGIAAEAQLGEHGDRGALVVALPRQVDRALGVGRGVGDGHWQGARGDPGEPLVVGAQKLHAAQSGSTPRARCPVGQDESMDRQQEYVLRTIEERDIRFVRLWFTDILGALKSVAVAPAELEQAFTEGIGFDGSAIEGFTRVYEADMIVQPDASTFQVLPWRGDNPGTARMFADILMPDGTPSMTDPRHVLKRALNAAADDGFTFYTHPEIEFYLFKEPYEPGTDAGAGRPGRLLRPCRPGRRTRLPAGRDHHAGGDGHLRGVQPPRGWTGPERDRPALRRRPVDGRQHHDLPHRRAGGGAAARGPGLVHAQAAARPAGLRHAHARLALRGRHQRLLRAVGELRDAARPAAGSPPGCCCMPARSAP